MALVTQEMCKAWEKSGKLDFLKRCKEEVTANGSGFETIQEKDFKRMLYDVCWQMLKGLLKMEQLVNVLADVVELHPEIPVLLADTFAVLDIETLNNEDKEHRDKLMTLVQECYPIVPEALIKAHLDQDTLENIGLLSSKMSFQQKYVKVKTKLYYKQQKFNLLREETEGYSKLITELNQDFSDGPTNAVILENIKSLIGCFNLDPNRVLDIILESFECRPDVDELFVPLLRTYISDPSTVCQMLGFKFHFYQQTQDSETPTSLYKIAAVLLQHELIDLDILYSHLSPNDSDIIERHKRELLEARQYARKLNVVMLSDKTNDKDKEDKENKLDQNTNNQKLGLCEACIQIGNWKHAKMIMDRLPPFLAVAHKPVADALCGLVSYIIEPVYMAQAGLPEALLTHRPSLDPQQTFQIEQAKTWVELVHMAFPLACCLGPHLACDAVLMGKLIRLARCFMEKKSQIRDAAEADEVFRGFLTIVDEILLPSLSQLPCNCCMAEELWSYIKLLHYEHRYRLYGQWKNDRVALHPKLIRTRADVIDKAKYIMKRLAKENVKQMGRQIGKLSHNNPGVLFEFILSQIQKYDNFIGPVVDSLKFLTGLSYDVMAYCIIEALANPERERLKHDDTNISLWLQSLAAFCGAVFKKYPIDLAGITQYVANQLKAGKSYDLLILREIVQKMVGIEVSEEVTDDQLEAMCGGELLRSEGGYFSQVRNTKKSSSRLKEALLDNNLAIPICLLMAQQRNAIVFTQELEDHRHIKLIGKLYDQCQDTLVQFVTFLSLQLSTDEFQKRLPAMDELMETYQVSPDVAFALWRIPYGSAIQAKYEELRRVDKKEKTESSNSQSAKVQRYMDSCSTVMSPVRNLIYPLNPPKVWDEISLQFYTTFWSLSMYDLHVPSAAYDRQKAALKSQMNAIDDSKDLAQSKKKKEKERCQAVIDKLSEEERKQEEHVKMVRNRLKQERETWFASKSVPKQSMITAVLQLCLFPRCCFTTNDAVYCAKYLHIMHSLKTPNFSSLICYDRIFTEATWAISSCTESEAHRFGRFLCTVLDDIMRWHSDKNIFEKECANFPGFVTVFRVPKTDSTSPPADSLDFENYRHVVHKWQYSLCVTSVNNIESKDYIQIRNALIVLTKMLPHFPRVLRFGSALEKRVEKLCQEEKDKRPDIYALAMGYVGQLKGRKKTWIEESEFHITKKPGPPPSESKSAPATTDKSRSESAVNRESGKENKEAGDKRDSAASKDKKLVRSSSRAESKEIKDNKTEAERADSKERRENGKDSKERRSKSNENGKESKVKDPEKESKLKEREARVKDTKPRAQDKNIREKDKRHKEKKEDKSPKEDRPEKPSKEERELAKKDERERRKEEKEREKQIAEEREMQLREEMERERSKEERERIKDEKRQTRALEKEREKEIIRRERDHLRERERENDRDFYEQDRDRTRDRGDHREPDLETDRSANSHGHRRSADPSPKPVEDRDMKRRKLEAKELHHTTDYWERPHKSPGHDRIDYESPREREKRDRKRVSLDRSTDDRDHTTVESKRHRTDEQERQNGDSRAKDRSRSSERERDARLESDTKTTSRKSSPEKTDKARQRKSEKHGTKKSKHH